MVMTDEIIREEAAKYVYNFEPTGVITEDRLKCYLAGAHSRDAEIEEMKDVLDVVSKDGAESDAAYEKLKEQYDQLKAIVVTDTQLEEMAKMRGCIEGTAEYYGFIEGGQYVRRIFENEAGWRTEDDIIKGACNYIKKFAEMLKKQGVKPMSKAVENAIFDAYANGAKGGV